MGKQNALVDPIGLQAANSKPLLEKKKKAFSLIRLAKIFSDSNDDIKNNDSSKLNRMLTICQESF